MLNAEIYTIPYEFCSFELCTIICDDSSSNVESENYTLQKLDCCLMCNSYYWHYFHPLSERVNDDEKKHVSS
jgi:hypothetical protein